MDALKHILDVQEDLLKQHPDTNARTCDQTRATGSSPAKWVRLGQRQHFTSIGEVPETQVFDERPALWWGTAVYEVNPDGTLRLLAADFDSSD